MGTRGVRVAVLATAVPTTVWGAMTRPVRDLGRLVDRLGHALDELSELLIAAQRLADAAERITASAESLDTSAQEIHVSAGAIVETLPTLERLTGIIQPLETSAERFGRFVDRLPGGARRTPPPHRQLPEGHARQ